MKKIDRKFENSEKNMAWNFENDKKIDKKIG